MIVDLFVPCYIDQLYPQTAFNAIKVLEKCNVEVHYNPQQTCCGKIAFESGYWDEATELGEKFLTEFTGEHTIVGLSTSCVAYIQTQYKKMFYNSGSHLQYQKVKNNIFDFSDFMVNILKISDLGATMETKATYLDSCSALRKYNKVLINEPRILLKNVSGLELVEMKERDVCCGYSDMFAIKYSAVSSSLVEQKVTNALETGANYIIVSDSGCMINLDGYIKKHNLPIKIIHLIDVLASF